MHKKETTKEWVNQVFGKTSTDQAKGSDVKEVHTNEKDNSNEKQITVDKTAKEESNAKEVNEATIDNYQSIEQQSAEDNGVSHNLGEEELLVLEENQAIGVSEVEYPNEEMNYLPLEANLSPKLLKSSRKGK
ncbi:hypothetical protein KY289_036597 [Solanum tuberosum]|nr:hypothetical protein KY289_036597 [Solanum tuberosum]